MADASTQGPKVEFEGFANTVDKGKIVDARNVKAFRDNSDDGKIRRASQKAKSSIVKHRTEGTGTNGAPTAVVGKSATETRLARKEGSTEPTATAEGRGANAG